MSETVLQKPFPADRIQMPARFGTFPADGNWSPAQIADFDTWFATVPHGATVWTTASSSGLIKNLERCMAASA